MDDEATNGPPRAMTTPRVYQPLVEDVTPPSDRMIRHENDTTLATLDQGPDIPTPHVFGGDEPMEVNSTPTKEPPLDGEETGVLWDTSTPPGVADTDAEFCRRLENIAQQL